MVVECCINIIQYMRIVSKVVSLFLWAWENGYLCLMSPHLIVSVLTPNCGVTVTFLLIQTKGLELFFFLKK